MSDLIPSHVQSNQSSPRFKSGAGWPFTNQEVQPRISSQAPHCDSVGGFTSIAVAVQIRLATPGPSTRPLSRVQRCHAPRVQWHVKGDKGVGLVMLQCVGMLDVQCRIYPVRLSRVGLRRSARQPHFHLVCSTSCVDGRMFE